MQFKTIMVPFDGSDHAKAALECAKGLLGDSPEAKLLVVQAVPTGSLNIEDGVHDGVALGQFEYDQYRQLVDHAVAAAKAKVEAELGDELAGLGGRAQIEAVPSLSVVETLASYASEHGVDLIVMGRRGLGAIRGMVGSVSYGLLRETDIPVLTVK